MTTSSRMEQSIRPDYHHHLQHPHHHQLIHSLHEVSLPASNDEPAHRPLPPLAYLTAAAAACSPLLVSSSPTMGDTQEQPQQQSQPLRDREEHLFSRKSVEDHQRHDQGLTSSLGPAQFTHQPVPTSRFQVQSHLSQDGLDNSNQHSKDVETSREYLSDKDRRSSEDRGLYAQQHQQQQRHQDQEAVHPFASSAEDSRRLTLLSKTTSSAYDTPSTVSEFTPDVEMKPTEALSRRGSMAMILDCSTTPSPKGTHDHHDHPRKGGHYPYSQEHPHSQQRRPSHAFIPSEHTSGYSGPRHPHESQYSSGSGPHPGQSQISPTTPSPPLPSTLSTDFHQRRPLPPIEPSQSLHSFMSSSRRGSVTDPELHAVVTGKLHRRPSISTLDTSSTGGGGHYNTNHGVSPTSTTASSPSDSHYPPHGSHSPRNHPHLSHHQQHTSSSGPLPPTPVGPPSESALAAYLTNRRESLPSIHSRAGPLGQLLAQEPQRRHSIANGSLDPNYPTSSMNNSGSSALKRKTSGILLTQTHTTSTMDYPAKRRDSIPDLHLTHPGIGGGGGGGGGYLHPSPPRRGSIASLPTTNGNNSSANGPHVPALNLQPAAEIKSLSSSLGPGPLDYTRGQFPIHPMRRPSLFAESGLPTPPSQLPSRRASLADLHLGQQQPSPQQTFQRHPAPGPSSSSTSSSTSSSQHDYDYHMGMDLEKMHLSSQGPEPMPHSSKPQGSGPPGSHYPASHLYPGYGYDSASMRFQGANKGDTPYSRSPELRVSHKLAERKRRKEMKELFDELRDALPVDRSLKTSKWEILSKAVDYIANMKANQDGMVREIDMLRQEMSRLKR